MKVRFGDGLRGALGRGIVLHVGNEDSFDTGFLFWPVRLVGPADDGVVVAEIMPIMMVKS